jgi:hypothetical protein
MDGMKIDGSTFHGPRDEMNFNKFMNTFSLSRVPISKLNSNHDGICSIFFRFDSEREPRDGFPFNFTTLSMFQHFSFVPMFSFYRCQREEVPIDTHFNNKK